MSQDRSAKSESVEILLAEGEAYLASGNFPRAIAASQQAIKLEPSSAEAYKLLGNIFQARGNLDGAMRAYERAVEIRPSFAEAVANLGSIFYRQDKLKRAAEYYERAIALNPELAGAYLNLGNVWRDLGEKSRALASWQEALSRNPDIGGAQFQMKLGNFLLELSQHSQAIACYQRAILLSESFGKQLASGQEKQVRSKAVAEDPPQTPPLRLRSGHAFARGGKEALLKKGDLGGSSAASSNSLFLAQARSNLGSALLYMGRTEEAIRAFEEALAEGHNLAEIYCNLGLAVRQQGKERGSFQVEQLNKAFGFFEKAIAAKPDLLEAHQGLFDLITTPRPGSFNYAPLRAVAEKYCQSCQEPGRLTADTALLHVYLNSAIAQTAREKFLEIERQLYLGSDELSQKHLTILYPVLLFSMYRLRDNRRDNSRLSKLLGEQCVANLAGKYAEGHGALGIGHGSGGAEEQGAGSRGTWAKGRTTTNSKLYPMPNAQCPMPNAQCPMPNAQLKIGFISAHFHRHPVTWCSADVIAELSQISPQLYFYLTQDTKIDDLTDTIAKVATKFYRQEVKQAGTINSSALLEEIQQDDLDILVDIDSITVNVHADLLYCQPARACISWLGFEAPYISANNYFLADWHTHPVGIEGDYREQLLRMPDSFMAVAGFDVAPAEPFSLRQSMRIGLEQIVYLCVAPATKLNPELVAAQISILKQVPDSLLLYKGRGEPAGIQRLYWEACETIGVSWSRIKFIDLTKTEEEHRTIYRVADVLLDSYPYNGGSHNLEALWFELPVVTRAGEQFLARMAYSFLKTLSISEGIAWSWEEYVEWGVRLGQERELRQAIRDRLVRSKQPDNLSPLWNPQKFARDLYALFGESLKKG
ncbi:MAG: tetratricopeptide repeat protein [Oscillatoria sp. SIO1A7]|nr:tetratricopeptide repeat protein [Oscillatoria sp. SIO1A7]